MIVIFKPIFFESLYIFVVRRKNPKGKVREKNLISSLTAFYTGILFHVFIYFSSFLEGEVFKNKN